MKGENLKPTIDLDAKIAELNQELTELAEKLEAQTKLAAADMANAKKRYTSQINQAEQYAVEKFALDMITTLDALQMAQNSASGKDEISTGLEMAINVFLKNLEKHGITPITTENSTFNPEIHVAVKTEDSQEHNTNTIISTIQAGYMIHERVLKPAMVIVAN